jgi:hypothetical protein
MNRQPPTESECIEALTVMLETYSWSRVEQLLEIAKQDLRRERVQVEAS